MAIQSWGIGKTDYSDEVSVGQFLLGIGIKATDATLPLILSCADKGATSPLCFLQDRIMPGQVRHMTNGPTGQPGPWSWPAGYSIRFISYWWSFSEPSRSWWTASLPATGANVRYFAGEWHSDVKSQWYEHDVQSFDTRFFDPNSEYPFSVDVMVKNLGDRPMSCHVDIICILRAWGSKNLPENKLVRCKFCGHNHEVPNDTSKADCPECGMVTFYYNTPRPRASVKGPLEES